VTTRHNGKRCEASHCDVCGRCGHEVQLEIVISGNRKGAYLKVLCPTCSEAQRMAEQLESRD